MDSCIVPGANLATGSMLPVARQTPEPRAYLSLGTLPSTPLT